MREVFRQTIGVKFWNGLREVFGMVFGCAKNTLAKHAQKYQNVYQKLGVDFVREICVDFFGA